MGKDLANMRPPRAGDRAISASYIAAIVEEVLAARNLSGDNVTMTPTGGYISSPPKNPMPLFGEIVGAASTAGFYEWKQIRVNTSTSKADTPTPKLDQTNYGDLLVLDPLGGFTVGLPPKTVVRVLDVLAQDGKTTRLGVPIGADFFHGVLGSATTISGELNRWAYPFQQVKYDSTGEWAVIAGGVTGTAYNTIEAGNTGSGVQGCGINVSNLPSGVTLQPLGAGAVVKIYRVVNCDTLAIEYTFEASNNADGACTS